MKKHKYILALDQGTTSSRAIVFDDTGAVVSSAQAEFAQVYPAEGWSNTIRSRYTRRKWVL